MRLATVDQCREIDSLSVKVYGLTDDILMESAGVSAVREIQTNFYPELTRGMTAVICGPGNNGGDGLVIARHLHSNGFRDVTAFLLAPAAKRSTMFKKQLERAENHGIKVVDLLKTPKKATALQSSALIIDALFGIGFKKGLGDAQRKIIELMNSLKVPVVSVDCPSGLDCDRGQVNEIAVRAHTTLTFGLAKPGFFAGEGPLHTGKLRILSIGYPFECLRGNATTHFLFNERLARRYLPARKQQSNKSDFGHLLVMAGSPGMWGAGVLASQAAFRMGAGYVTWASRKLPIEKLEATPEVYMADLADENIWNFKKITAVAVGPGMGVDEVTAQVLRRLKNLKVPKVVVDADAITAAVKYKLFPFPKSWVITPHSGELARIIGGEARDVDANRFAAAKAGAKKSGCHVLLKGFRSIVAHENRCMVIQSGNAALAKAGTGDVLTGMIGGLLAQGLDTLQATSTAAYIHGRLADEWVRGGNDQRTLTAGDLKDSLGSLLHRVTHSIIF